MLILVYHLFIKSIICYSILTAKCKNSNTDKPMTKNLCIHKIKIQNV